MKSKIIVVEVAENIYLDFKGHYTYDITQADRYPDFLQASYRATSLRAFGSFPNAQAVHFEIEISVTRLEP